jgi:hypothetical protein
MMPFRVLFLLFLPLPRFLFLLHQLRLPKGAQLDLLLSLPNLIEI